ncbi:MAG: T9SS type A sorting domain-containing protein [Ignavibacteriales bacterium]|nr:T9SS type A sorting domain-containing protein [Ignavibacteriales bacterium]
MKNLVLFLFVPFLLISITMAQTMDYSWRYYNTGNTGIQGDYVEGIWIDHDGDPYIAAYTPGWEEGGFAKYIQSENKWINYSNIDYPVIGDINDVGSSRISDIEEDANGTLWMATWRGILKFNPAVGGSSLEFFSANNSLHPGGRTSDIAIAPDGSIWASVISVVWGGGGLVNYNPATNQWRYWYYGSNANNWPSLIGYCEHVSIQEKTVGGYVVWVDGEGWNTMITFDSDTQLFTLLPQNGDPGEVVSFSGNDNLDDSNNLWATRQSSTPSVFSLDYRTPAGTWISPVQPPVSLALDVWAFKAYGNGNALLIDGNSNVWQFNGTNWQNLGIWREGGFSYGVDIDANGNIWVTGIGGAAKRDAVTGQWQRHRITNSSQIDYWVNDISIDDQGNVWMTGNAGTGMGGFQKFDGTRWIGFNESTYGLGNPFPFPTDNSEAIYYRPSNGAVIVNPMFNSLHSWNGSNYSSLNYSLSRSQGLVEDSQNRLWSLGEYYNLSYYNDVGNNWTDVPFIGISTNIKKDPQRAGTIWACSFYQVLRTDGSYNFSKVADDFSELNPQSDVLTTVVPIQDGFAWVGTNQGLAKVNANNGTYQFYSPSNSQIPGENVSPLAVTPDGRLWFANFQSTTTSTYGLCWFDGTAFGIIPQQQIGGLPHAQIYDLEVKNIQNGYELWISCASRGIAVLTVTGSVVPVELVSFSASTNENNVNLNWSTSTETNNSGFSIERKQVYSQQSSIGTGEWTELAFINGNGTTTETQSYSFVDNNLSSGKYLYRLKQIDFDGTFEYSNEIEVIVTIPEKFELSQNYPNPFNPSTKIKYQIVTSNPVSLKIYDVLGNEVATLVNEVQPSGNYEVTFDAASLSSGTYFYKLQTGSLVETKKMLLLK